MRKDVKAGLILSLIVVVFAGWYYLDDEPSEKTIALNQPQAPPQKEAVKEPSTASRRIADRSGRNRPPASTRSRPRTGDKSSSKPLPQRVASRRSNSDSPIGPKSKKPAPVPAKTQKPQEAKASAGRTASPVEKLPPRKDVLLTAKTPKQSAKPIEKRLSEKQTEDQAVERHRVQPGDTFSVLASIYYGSERYTKFLIESNPQIKDPKSIPVGASIRIPSLPQSMKSRGLGSPVLRRDDMATTSAGVRTYVVKENDSLYKVAARYLGDGNRWRELHELNKDVLGSDPSRLRPGQVLKMPPGASANRKSKAP